MIKYFFYLECEDLNNIKSLLDEYVNDNLIIYNIDDVEGVIEIKTNDLTVDDELWDILESNDLIEDVDKCIDDNDDYSDFDNFYNTDDI
jgi:hypothetical protein